MKAREKWGLLMLKNWDQENFDIIILLEFKEFHIMNYYTLFSTSCGIKKEVFLEEINTSDTLTII